MKHWKRIPETARRLVFFDALPNASNGFGLPLFRGHALSHAKVLFAQAAGDLGILYVGSHNFSKTAWGLKGASPQNVEVGVVLATQSMTVKQEWISRLPYRLPDRHSLSPPSYVPASAHEDIAKTLKVTGNLQLALTMLRHSLKKRCKDAEQEGRKSSTAVTVD